MSPGEAELEVKLYSSILVSLSRVFCGFPGNALEVGGSDKAMNCRGGTLEREDLCS